MLAMLSTALLEAAGVAPAAMPPAALPQHVNPATAWNDGRIHSYHVQGNVWLMAGEPDESNVVVQVGNQGALVVDTGVQSWADKLLASVTQLVARHAGDQKAIRIIVDTDGLPDHIGGNAVMRLGGSKIVAGNFAFDNPGLARGARVIADQNVLLRLVAGSANAPKGTQPVPEALWPTETQTFNQYNLQFNGSAVELIHPHHATTDGNYMVMFRSADVLAAGDVVDMRGYPVIDVTRGGTIDGELVALNRIIDDIAVPGHQQQYGTLIVPGHGRLCDESDIAHYRNLLTVIRNRVQYYKDRGKTLQQVLALKPSWDYDGRWGHSSARWGARQFIAAVYRTLPAKGPSFSMKTEIVVPANAKPGHGRYY